MKITINNEEIYVHKHIYTYHKDSDSLHRLTLVGHKYIERGTNDEIDLEDPVNFKAVKTIVSSRPTEMKFKYGSRRHNCNVFIDWLEAWHYYD